MLKVWCIQLTLFFRPKIRKEASKMVDEYYENN